MYDIIVVGGGHAGVEAAHIASQFKDLKIALFSLPGVGLASAPCNPAVGGVGKGQVVRELDALGGLMGVLADKAGIQFRTLNESKGFAVQSTRVQIDKVVYSKLAEEHLSKLPNLKIIKKKISKITRSSGNFSIESLDGFTVETRKLIITVGTFLNGILHTGGEKTIGGREGCESSGSIGALFSDIKTQSARFKTGTPARLDKKTIDFSKLEEQPSDFKVETFHFSHKASARFLPQVSCYLGYTNPETMMIIRENKERSPMFNGQIKGVGARYCPSIEDKAYRYPDKDKHHVFVEPESLELDSVYPSGISTSLPKDVQEQMVRSIKGLENTEILKYGYAVEYDVVDTTQLNLSLEMKELPGLYFAGQINGTSGYEEAAGQGFIAGANAALKLLDRKPLVISRNDSYIGVMIEDLVTNLRDEPYRLFTARSENRLFIREDNTYLRMAPYRKHLGLMCKVDSYLDVFSSKFTLYYELLSNTYIGAKDSFAIAFDINVPRRTSLAEILRYSQLNPVETLKRYLNFCGLEEDCRLIRTIAITIKYDGYINKSDQHNQKLNKFDDKKIKWEELISSENISFECKQRIEKIKPETFGQLKRIEGIRPATLISVAGSIQ